MGPFEHMAGTVVAFDERGGYGTVWDADGTSWTFHCTAIVSGERVIELGTEVEFDVVPGRMGRWEATKVRPA